MTPREGRGPSKIEDPGPRSFGSIESSDAFVALLLQAVEETATDVGEDLRLTHGAGGRRREALQLVAYKLEQLRFHLATSRRRLNDLRNLRLIVEGEPSMDRERREGLERCA
jgi:hypothetical protein